MVLTEDELVVDGKIPLPSKFMMFYDKYPGWFLAFIFPSQTLLLFSCHREFTTESPIDVMVK